MKNNASFLYSAWLIVTDALALIGAFIGAYVLRVSIGGKPIAEPVPARTYLAILATLIPFWIVIFGLIGLYNRIVYEKRFQEIGRIFMGTIVGTLFIIGYEYFGSDTIFPAKLVPVYGFGLTFTLLIISRNLARLVRHYLFSKNIGISNVLLVGNTDATQELVSWLANPRVSGYKIVGIVGDSKNSGVKHFATFDEAIKSLNRLGIHSIMQTELFTDQDKNNEILSYAQNNHVSYRFIPGNSELFVGNIDVELFQSSIPMIAVHQTALFGWGRIVKRLFDIGASWLILILLSPLILLISLLVFISDPGPIFFRQKRITRFGSVFKIFKFRTVKRKYNGKSPEEAFEIMGKPHLAKQYRENGDQLANDPRITWFGQFLRRTSLDELPQLINVIKGDISLVGPRALVPEEINAAESKHHIISVKSGITGLAQVSGRRDISVEERRKLDLYYVQNWSFWLDITILFKTLRVIIKGS